jgi:hypothetical protein
MSESAKGWKDHPLGIATAVALSTFGATVLVFKEIVIPTQTAQFQNQIVALQKQVLSLSDEVGKTSASLAGLNRYFLGSWRRYHHNLMSWYNSMAFRGSTKSITMANMTTCAGAIRITASLQVSCPLM